MLKKDGMRWHCPNRDCDWSVLAQVPATGDAAPRCVCGTEMKRVEVVRVSTYLDFLRGPGPVEEEVSKEV
jgi:hypothetical protein